MELRVPKGGEAGEWDLNEEDPVHIHSVLFTLNGCGMQAIHADGPDPHCISSICALEPGQEIRIAVGPEGGPRRLRCVALETGEIVFFRGHVCHSGSDPPGMRLHTYMFAPDYKFEDLVLNATYQESDLYRRMSALTWDARMPPVVSQRGAEARSARAAAAASAARAVQPESQQSPKRRRFNRKDL